jgi:EAL domain-containing protein (putative c-di-GMP-specific phosphodiesterase class I)
VIPTCPKHRTPTCRRSRLSRSCTDAGSAATISAIVKFARDVGVGVIAQGVETEEQRALLSSTDSTAGAQGFHFSKAVGAAEAAELLRRGRIEITETHSPAPTLAAFPQAAV